MREVFASAGLNGEQRADSIAELRETSSSSLGVWLTRNADPNFERISRAPVSTCSTSSIRVVEEKGVHRKEHDFGLRVTHSGSVVELPEEPHGEVD